MLERFDPYLFFMKYIPYYTLFLITLFIGTIISLSSNHWIYVWIGFEVNLLSFIPIILQSQNNQETEASVKYFLIQALGSSLILMSSLSILLQNFSVFSHNITSIALSLALIIKMGVAPFHFWLPQLIINISWPICVILATWQKIAPLFIITTLSRLIINKFFIFIAVIRTIVGALGGLNQTHLRALLAYSSIGHIGWIIASSILSSLTIILYFFIYSAITVRIIIILNINSTKNNYISSISNTNKVIIITLIILFFSLGGLPPLLGFLPKWVIIKTLVFQNILRFSLIIITSSLVRLFYYLSLFFNIFTNYSSNTFYNKNKRLPSFIINTSIISTLSLGIIPLLI